jgi:hypothetical protein
MSRAAVVASACLQPRWVAAALEHSGAPRMCACLLSFARPRASEMRKGDGAVMWGQGGTVGWGGKPPTGAAELPALLSYTLPSCWRR